MSAAIISALQRAIYPLNLLDLFYLHPTAVGHRKIRNKMRRGIVLMEEGSGKTHSLKTKKKKN
jgi:hypothetical protein